MPRYEKYPNESPAEARARISKNIAQDRGGQRGVAQPPVAPVENRSEMMEEGYEAVPMTKRPRRRPGYNFTKNLGETPDIGY